MFYKNNWFSWTYDDGPEYGSKLTPTAKFNIHLKNTITRPVKSYYEELLENGRVIRDTFSGPLDLLFSGGIDSEIILRVYTDLKIPINVYIFKYENDYNLIEYTQALKSCAKLGVTPKVIDFNLQKFFENDAYDIQQKVFASASGWLPHMKLTEYCDGLPIMGSGNPYIRRRSRDMTSKFPWVFELDEKCHHWAVYHKTINRPCITDWYEYSPELLVSYFDLPFVQQLLNDEVPGKLSNESTKVQVHQEYWTDLDLRPKLIGFEGPKPDKSKSDVQEFMLDFGKKYMRGVVPDQYPYIFSQEELIKLIGS
jgi:hypothetical protein